MPSGAFKEPNLTVRFDFNSEYAGTTLPVSDATTLDVREILNKAYIKPKVDLQANIEKISWNGWGNQVEAQVKGTINNPNPLDLVVNGIKIIAQNKQGTALGSDFITGDFIVAPNSDFSFEKSIILPVLSLNESRITVTADVPATTLYSILSFTGKTTMANRKLAELIKVPSIVLDAKANWTETPPDLYLNFAIDTTLTNDNPWNLITGDLVINVDKPINTTAATTTQIGSIQGLFANSTKTTTSLITLYPERVGDIAGDVTITASIPIGLEYVKERIPVSSSLKLNLRPDMPIQVLK